MPKSFNIDLWQTLRTQGFLDNKIYFGLAPEDTPAPYCVLHVLDNGIDTEAQTLCFREPSSNTPGLSSIQFNIYSSNDMQLDELLQELNAIILNLNNLTEYRIIQALRKNTKNASTFSGEVGKGFTEFDFTYEFL